MRYQLTAIFTRPWFPNGLSLRLIESRENHYGGALRRLNAITAQLYTDLGYLTCDDQEALQAFSTLARAEGILPALESAHALAAALRVAQSATGPVRILVNLSGRGDKDLETVLRHLSPEGAAE